MRAAALAGFAAVMAISADASGPNATRHGVRADVPWTVGETLEYRVSFGPFHVGTARLLVIEMDTIRGEPCYQVQFTIHAHALFYTLDDSMRSWFGASDLVSRRFAQNTNDNGTLRAHRYEIFPERRMWIRDEQDSAGTVPEPLDDASFFFFARTLPYEDEQTYILPRYFLADRNPITIRVLGRQSIRVPAGRFGAVVVRPIFKTGGIFGEGGEATIWFSDDSTRIPLRIRASMVLGTLDISLRSRN